LPIVLAGIACVFCSTTIGLFFTHFYTITHLDCYSLECPFCSSLTVTCVIVFVFILIICYSLQMYSTVCRVATVLQTRYTAPGFWRAGLNLFVGAEKLVTNPAEKDHLKSCISRAREHLDEKENEDSMPSNREAGMYHTKI
jgi:hypothetical protein